MDNHTEKQAKFYDNKTRYSARQAEFYDKNPPLTPWPKLLVKYGFSVLYKPREVFWKIYLDKLHLREKDKVLDLGCGQGVMLARLKKTYSIRGIGIDISERMIEYAKKNFSQDNLSYLRANIEKIPFPDNTFDAVVSFDVLEHTAAYKKVIVEAFRVLKPGGKLLIYTMNKNYQYTLDWIWEKLGLDIFSRAAHDPKYFLDLKSLLNVLIKIRFNLLYARYYGGIFNLGVDEGIMVLVLLMQKLKAFKISIIGYVFLSFVNLLSICVYPIFQLFDSLWFLKSRSLGFIIIAEKQ